MRRTTKGTSFLSRSRFSSCAVVGSAGGLYGSHHGPAIDGYNAIFRFNTAPVTPYAKDVGNRSTLWLASHYPWRTQLRELRARELRVKSGERSAVASTFGVLSLYCFNSWLGSCHADALIGERGYSLFINPVLVARVMAFQQAHQGSGSTNVRPSTGLTGVAVALTACDQVTLFGFANDSNAQSAASCNHYYDCRYNQTRYFSGKMGHHDWHAQWRLLESLISRRAVCVFSEIVD